MLLAIQIERTLSLGGNVSIQSSSYVSSQLERFAAIAANSGAQLTLRNAETLLQSNRERIASIGGGKVFFVFT